MRRLKLFGPMVELSRLQREVNRLFSAFVESNNPVIAPASGWDPSVDIVDDGNTIRVLFELPGVDPGDVKVTVRGRVVTIRGTKRGRKRPREGLRFFCMERYFGSFVKSVPLPRPVNSRQAKSKLSRGLLEVVLPRVPDLREKEIEIAVKSEEEPEK
ncbi:MAG TPA: Hsp20/alpha crystallin family protein [Thermoanaerobaculia bacterium]|jgi:HSP20 family protein|nr:Hsp20/alpha crystallin family protein [Thermoanaerobaculia bacterium]